MIAGKCTSRKWDAFKSVLNRVQGMQVPVKVMGKAGGSKETWMMREIEALVRKKEA